jgi:hypothetical protein
MPSALAAAATALKDKSLLGPAIGDAAGFTPLMMTIGGPENGWLPAPIDRTQIAYGVDARLQGLLGVADAADRPGLRQVAAFVAAWYFGANRAGVAIYDPTTGRTFDGVAGDGGVNRNSGAESTIHGLLSMLALDHDPTLANQARALGAGTRSISGLQVIEAEAAALTGASILTPPSSWTGESQWSNGSYISMPSGARATWTVLSSDQTRLVLPIVNLVADPHIGRTHWTSGHATLGSINHGTGGPQGNSAAPGALLPVTLASALPANATQITATATSTGRLDVDALLLLPTISTLRLGTSELLVSVDPHPRTVALPTPSTTYTYDQSGRLHSQRKSSKQALVLPGGFTITC